MRLPRILPRPSVCTVPNAFLRLSPSPCGGGGLRVGSAWLFGKSRGSLFEMLAGGCRILGSRRIVRIYRDERYKCKGQVEKFVPKKGERDKRETYLYRRVIRIEKKERKKKKGGGIERKAWSVKSLL